MNGHWQSEGKGSWTAISQTLSNVLASLAKGDCWYGGEFFTGTKSNWSNDDGRHIVHRQDQDMFCLSKPDDAAVQDSIRRQSSLEFSYSEVGATASGDGPPSSEYRWDVVRVSLGSGQERFASAIAAFRSWRQFDVGWAEAVPSNTPIEPGQVVAVRARIAGVWSLHACRIIYVIDETGPISRFGFGYGTLPGHAEAGEERFLIEWDHSTGEVTYDVRAFFRPRHPLVKFGWPIGIWLVNRFRRDSAEAMRRAASAVSLNVEPDCY